MNVCIAVRAQQILVRLQWIANLDRGFVSFCDERAMRAIRQCQRHDEIVDTVDLTGLFPLLGNDFVLTGANIIIPYGGANRGRLSRIGLFKYPKGGKLQKVVHRVDFLYDLTLSD